MPEGPEVKIAANYFNSFFENSKVIKFTLITDYYKKKYKNIFEIVNSSIKCHPKTYTIGKNIFINLNNKLVFNLHLGMTGGWIERNIKHCHFMVSDKKKSLFFIDVRKFGNMRIFKQEEIQQLYNSNFDPLNTSYNFMKHIQFLEEKVKNEKTICKILMDQKLFPGVGNYIKSEVLFASQIHPEEKWGNISTKKRKTLIKIMKKIMHQSLKSGGAELKDFKNPFHKSKFKLKIYGQQYTPGKNIIKSILTSDNRKSWICVKSQKLTKET